MPEMLDIVDENGLPTGRSVLRTVAHAEGLRHRTSHVWILVIFIAIAPLITKNTVRFQPCFSVRDRTVSKIIANYGVCRLPSRLRVWVQVVTVFSQGYFAASFSFRSTPRPGLSLA